ncbi:MAG: hypothetical protein HZA09_00120 [Nitrospirae bacterium]|nr:hypothetical protein [Nitrospirota bacterium]
MERDRDTEEIELTDYLRVIWKKKWLILILPLVAVIVAGVMSLRMPKVYKVRTILEVGKVNNETIENLDNLSKKIEVLYRHLIEKMLNINSPAIATHILGPANLVIISLKDTKDGHGIRILKGINDLVIEDHKRLTDIKRAELARELSSIVFEEEGLLIEKPRLETEIKGFDRKKEGFKEWHEGQMSLKAAEEEGLLAEKTRLETEIKGFDRKKEMLREQLTATKSLIEELLRQMKNAGKEIEKEGAFVMVFSTSKLLETQSYYNRLQDELENSLPTEYEDLKVRLAGVSSRLKKVKVENEELRRQIQEKLETELPKEQGQFRRKLREIENDIREVTLKRNQKERILKDITETRVDSEPEYSELPTNLKKNVLLAGVVGLMFSIFLAFFVEYIEKVRIEEKKKA